VAALRHDGVVAPWIVDGPINGRSFLVYVREILVPALRPGDIVVLSAPLQNSPKAPTENSPGGLT